MCCKYVPSLNNAPPPKEESSEVITIVKSVGKYVVFAAVLVAAALIMTNLGVI